MKTKTTLAVPLKERENLKELFRILDENGLEKEKSQLTELADYIDSMDQQFGRVLEEIQTVREQLNQIQETGIRQSAVKVVVKVENKVQEAKAQLAAIKVKFLDDVNRTVAGFKKKGVLALSATMDSFRIRQGLDGIKNHFRESKESTDRGIGQLANIGDEIHGVKTHLGNIKRELAGKEPIKSGSRDVEKGAVFQMQKMLYGTMGMLDGMEKQTDRIIQKLDSLGNRANEIRKPSVKESLRSVQGSQALHRKQKNDIRKSFDKKKELVR